MGEKDESMMPILLEKGLNITAFIFDIITFVPWWISQIGSRYRLSQSFKKCQPIDGKVTGAHKATIHNRSNLLETSVGKALTLTECFDHVCDMYPNHSALGTRELLSETDEIQPNGKVFKKAIFGQYNWITYSEMKTRAYNLASGLSDLGVKRACIYMETRAEWMLAAHACFQHNIKLVTVYSTLGELSVTQAMEEADIEVVITSAVLMSTKMKSIIKSLPKIRTIIYAPFENRSQKLDTSSFPEKVKVVAYEDVVESGEKSSIKSNPNEPINKDTIAVVMYTSGTTGKPKGVLLSHQNIVSCASAMYTRVSDFNNPFNADTDSWLAYLPLAHILELAAENCVLLNGIKVGYGSTLTISDASSRIKKGSKGDATELRPTIMAAVPEISERIRKAVMSGVADMNPLRQALFNFAYKYKLRHKKKNMPTPLLDRFLFNKTKMLLGGKLRVFISGGAPLDVKTQRFINICICTDVTAGYGLTETTAGATLQDMFDNRVGNIGTVLDSSLVKLVDWKEGNYFVSDKPYPRGEVYIGGNTVGHGYYKMPEKTKEDFFTDEDGIRWFKTGDIGLIDDTGNVTLIDRKKDLVKLRHGEYVALGKVEACLKTSILCDNVCVFADQQELSCVAIAVANPVQIGRLCAQLGLKLEIEDACKNKQIIEKVFETFREAAKTGKLHKQEIPSKIYLISEQWTPESGFVTDALKLKRLVLNKHYADVVTQLYK